MKVFFINHEGGGFAEHIEIADGTTLKSVIADRVEGKPEDQLIRVNRQIAAADYVLQEGDRISCTPVNIKGAIFL